MTKPQPAPIRNNNPALWPLVVADMLVRDEFGLNKYGTQLQADNGRDFLRDTYEEILDTAVYIRGLIYERDGK